MLITKEKVINALHGNWRDDANEELIEDLIDSVTTFAENYTGRKLDYGEHEEHFWGGEKLISLAAAPIWEIVSVKIDGVLFTGYVSKEQMGILRHSRVWPDGEIEVKYKAGWDVSEGKPEPPADLSGAIRDEVVARFQYLRSQPRVGEGLVDLTGDFLTQSAEKVFNLYRLERI